MDDQLYEVQEGVRRAKAAWLCGFETIEAQVNGGPVFSVPLRCLRSPHKDEIDISDPKTLGDVMDTAEYLVAIPQNHEDRAEAECLAEVRAFLQDLEARYPRYNGVVTAFTVDPRAEASQEGPLAMTGG